MGAISQAIASSAKKFGAEIATNATVKKILYKGKGGKGTKHKTKAKSKKNE